MYLHVILTNMHVVSMLCEACHLNFNQEANADMQRMENERKVIQDSLQQSADQVTTQLAVATGKNTELESNNEVVFGIIA